MATYVLLMKWKAQKEAATSSGVLNHLGIVAGHGGTVHFENRRQIVEMALTVLEPPGKLDTLLWTLGETDMVAVVEAGDNEQIGGFSLYLNQVHGVTTQTLPAFEPSEMDVIAQVAARCGTTTAAALESAGR